MHSRIPAAQPLIGEEERAAVERVLRSGHLAQGTEVAAFEREFSDALVGGIPCVALSTGTSGAPLGLVAAGIGPGDEVIVPSFTFAATANAVALTGATPVFVDIDPDTFCIDPDAAHAAVGPRTAGVMPVHLYGHPADLSALSALCERQGLALFEDAAQAHGAAWEGRPVGSFGIFAMFSLYPTKNMTSGEGGMDAVRNGDVERRLRLLRNQGMERRYENELVGHNARMTDLHAALGRVQLTRLPDWNRRRRANAAYYSEHLRGVPVPSVDPRAEHVYHQYTIRVPQGRDEVARLLLEQHGVETGIYYPIPTHALPSYALDLDLPETVRAAAEVLSLPVHPGLSSQHLERVVTAVNAVAEKVIG